MRSANRSRRWAIGLARSPHYGTPCGSMRPARKRISRWASCCSTPAGLTMHCAASNRRPRAITRSRVLNWLRVAHVWTGLWGDARAIVRRGAPMRVTFAGQRMDQAELWTVTLATSKFSVSARHVPGSGLVDLETQDATSWGVLMRLHTGSGASAAWVLVVDTVAGALMVLTLSGVLLWTRLRTPRLAGAAVLLTAPVLTAVYLATL